MDFPAAKPGVMAAPGEAWRCWQVVPAALLLGFAAFTTSLRGMFLIVSKVGGFGGVEDHHLWWFQIWMYYGYTMDVLWIYYGFTVDVLWIYILDVYCIHMYMYTGEIFGDQSKLMIIQEDMVDLWSGLGGLLPLKKGLICAERKGGMTIQYDIIILVSNPPFPIIPL